MRKSNYNHLPSVRYNRSKFDLSHKRLLSMNLGDVVPLDCVEVLPGDTFINKTTALIRLTNPLIKPVMDNMYLDIHHFFVPMRLVYDKTEKIFGNASPSQYVDEEYARIPFFSDNDNTNDDGLITVTTGSVMDYLGCPIGQITADCTPLMARGFALIYNHWYRDENVIDETFVPTGEITDTEYPNDNAWSQSNYLGKLPKAKKRNDYFTSALPNAQKGEPVPLPLANGFISLQNYDSDLPYGSFNLFGDNGVVSVDGTANDNKLSLGGVSSVSDGNIVTFRNLGVDLSNGYFGNINDLRIANATQKYLERSALYGSRYTEYLNGAFGVTSPDARLQIPEYLGGGRVNINVQQVANTNGSNSGSSGQYPDTYLGSLGAFSLSNGFSKYSKGFVEHGYVYTIGVIKQVHTYSQGLPKMFTRRSKEDIYDTAFAMIGNQPIYKKEIFARDVENGNDIFGYKEAWSEYREIPNSVTGLARPTVYSKGISNPNNADYGTSGLVSWSMADDYTNAPVLSPSFVQETSTYLNRSLRVGSTNDLYSNFIVDFWHDLKAVRVMPTYSVPSMSSFK